MTSFWVLRGLPWQPSLLSHSCSTDLPYDRRVCQQRCHHADERERARRWRQCYVDEHYIPTLLAKHGHDNESDCHGGMVSTNWTMGGAHPMNYRTWQVTPDMCAQTGTHAPLL